MKNKIKYKMLPKQIREKWSYDDYLSYRMQEMNVNQIEGLMTSKELWESESKLNSDTHRHIFNSKRTFASFFERYMLRDIMYLDDVNLEEFESFVRRHEKVVLKPDDMYAGLGIVVITYDVGIITCKGAYEHILRSDGSLDFDLLKREHYIAEEYINQALKYSEVYPGALNTIRVTTLVKDDGEPEVIFAVNQFGSGGSIVDNDDDTAIWAVIDLETGKITACDINTKTGYVNEVHPDTYVCLLDFVNDDIADILKLALEAARVLPECRLVGWDIAVRKDGRLEIVEGNVTPELELYQKITGKGLREYLKIEDIDEAVDETYTMSIRGVSSVLNDVNELYMAIRSS